MSKIQKDECHLLFFFFFPEGTSVTPESSASESETGEEEIVFPSTFSVLYGKGTPVATVMDRWART